MRIAWSEKRFDGCAGARASMPAWAVGGEEEKAESSVRRRFVGDRVEEEDMVPR